MSLGILGSFGGIVKEIQNKNSNTILKKDEIDQQFILLLNHLKKLFFNKRYFLLFNYMTDSVKTENDLATTYKYILKTKAIENVQSGLFRLLMQRTRLIHSTIIEMVVEEIFVSYMDYQDYMKSYELDLAIEIKLSVMNLVNDFTVYLTEYRFLNEKLFDSYIYQIYEAQDIFNEQ